MIQKGDKVNVVLRGVTLPATVENAGDGERLDLLLNGGSVRLVNVPRDDGGTQVSSWHEISARNSEPRIAPISQIGTDNQQPETRN